MHNLPQSWVDRISADTPALKRWIALGVKADKIHQEEETKRWAGWKKEHPNQSIPANYSTSEQHEKQIRLQ